jgi:hypothetical protein
MNSNAQFRLRPNDGDNWPLYARYALMFGLSLALWAGIAISAIHTHI